MGAFNNNARAGTKAERFAEKWLLRNGFILLIRGKSHGRGKGYMPYDLIVSKDGQTYEIDVKSCKTHFMINPLSLCRLINGAQEKGHIPGLLFVYQRRILGLFGFQTLEPVSLSKII